jgi:hypothetical protein
LALFGLLGQKKEYYPYQHISAAFRTLNKQAAVPSILVKDKGAFLSMDQPIYFLHNFPR